MRESQSKEIAGLGVTVQQLPATRSLLLMHRLGRAVGPAMAKAIGGNKLAGLKLADLELSGIGEAVQMLFDRFTEQDLTHTLKELFESATISDGTAQLPFLRTMDDKFAGKPEALIQAVGFALEVNYGNFIGALLGFVGAHQAKAPPSKE